jgi:DNA-binding IclR family transcriptional regulator
MDRVKVDALLSQEDMKPYTQHTILSKDELLAVLDKAKNDGVSYDFEEFQLGLVCIAAPLWHKEGDPIAAISVSGPTVRLTEDVRREISHIVRDVASQIYNELSRLI